MNVFFSWFRLYWWRRSVRALCLVIQPNITWIQWHYTFISPSSSPSPDWVFSVEKKAYNINRIVVLKQCWQLSKNLVKIFYPSKNFLLHFFFSGRRYILVYVYCLLIELCVYVSVCERGVQYKFDRLWCGFVCVCRTQAHFNHAPR